MASQSGIDFVNPLPLERHLTNQIYANGSGVAAGDVDGDGLVDLFFAGLNSASRLYRNLGGFRFQDITEAAGVACPNLDATGTAFADLDGDGALDLIANSLGGGTRIFWNDGAGRFRLGEQILNAGRGAASLALADIDGDGFLDLYITNYRTETIKDQPGTRFSVKMVNGKPTVNAVNGRPISDPALRDRFDFSFSLSDGVGKFAHLENGEPDALYRNEGNRRFKEIPFTSGAFLDESGAPLAKTPLDWGLAVMFRDINGDNAPDIYVCNDFHSPDRLWFNNGSGVFRAAPPFALRRQSFSSMAVDFADVNRDGFDDFFTADMLSPDRQRRLVQQNLARNQPEANSENIDGRPQYHQNCLFINRGDGTFFECAQYSGVEASDWSWASIFLDVDLDGFEDLLIANGFIRDNTNVDILREIERLKAEKKLNPAEQLELRRLFPVLNTRNLTFRNLGDLTFQNVSTDWNFCDPGISQGMCLADLDNDGDMDVVVNDLNGSSGIYRNNSGAARVAVRLKGASPNTRGIGAKIAVFGGPVERQTQEMIAGGRYVSSDDPMRCFAAGAPTNQLRIEVTWRNGKKSVVENASADHIYMINEAGAQDAPISKNSKPTPLFEDVSMLIVHAHQREPFTDFDRQPSLPHKMDGFGPGIAWHDLDADGWEDLVIAAGRGGSMTTFLNDKKGAFLKSQKFAETPRRDQAAVIAFTSHVDGSQVLANFSNYHDAQAGFPGVRQYSWSRQSSVELLPSERWAYGALAMADIDGDGDLDLFIGGRMIPGRYPESGPSRICVNDGKTFRPGQELANIGLVNGAVWSDIVGDSSPELVLACEWGPIRVFKRDSQTFKEITDELGLGAYVGKWNGVTTGDFNADGRLDIVAGNWGRNNEYNRCRNRHLKIHFGRVSQRDVFLTSVFEPSLDKQAPITSYEQTTKSMPGLVERFPTAAGYSQASIDEILSGDAKGFKTVEVNWLETTVFLNQASSFAPVALPLEAQLAPAFAVCVGDADGDGAEDIFVGQNHFGLSFDKTRQDAGRSLWLRGDNKGHFEPLTAEKSGVIAYGEQRGAALCDYNHDGQIDLALTQRGAETKLFRNIGAKPGMRATLKGNDSNPFGIGAVVRLRHGQRLGPAREVHAGSGYLSQDAATIVLGPAETATAALVRWPFGKEIEYNLPANAKDVELRVTGELLSRK